MYGSRSLLTALCASLTALPAQAAEPECAVVRHVWELDLVEVAAEVERPDLDLNAVADALGTKARIGGGFVDPRSARDPVRIEMRGSNDGVGMRIRLERVP